MRLKTESGVSITIIEEGSSRVLLFDKSVRAVELNKEEISQISVLLTSNLKTKSDVADTESLRIQEESQETISEGR